MLTVDVNNFLCRIVQLLVVVGVDTLIIFIYN